MQGMLMHLKMEISGLIMLRYAEQQHNQLLCTTPKHQLVNIGKQFLKYGSFINQNS